MKQDLTDIIIVLDRSGSMAPVASDTIGGFNTFLEDQQKLPGVANMTLVQFDNEYEPIYVAKPVQESPKLTSATFVPRGGTALLDAIGRTIVTAGERLAAMPESDRPGKVVFVILTDGFENASREYTRDQIFKLITHQRENYQWQFVFLGANQDAIAVGGSMGIAAGSSMTYANNSVGTQTVLRATSSNIANYRTGTSASVDYSQKDRDDQTKAGAKA